MPRRDPEPEVRARRDGWVAIYRGGAYIDVHHSSRPGHALTCINVYDYAKGESTIPFRQTAVANKLAEWLERDEDGWREADDIIEHQLPYV